MDATHGTSMSGAASTAGGGMSGCHVATMADLNGALNGMEAKFDDHKRWCESELAKLMKDLRGSNDRIETADRESSAAIEGVTADLKALRAGMITTSSFRRERADIDKQLDASKEETEARIEHLKNWVDKEMGNIVGSMRSKVETASATVISLQEKTRVLEDTTIPQIKSEVEEQKAKRLGECQRLESEIEKAKDGLDQKISHTAAALRFYVTATASKLREELVPLTSLKELEEEMKQKDSELQLKMKSCEDVVAILRTENAKQKEQIETSLEKQQDTVGKNSKNVKILETSVQSLQSSVASDVQALHEQQRADKAGLQTEIADARAAGARAAMANDNALQALAQDTNMLKASNEKLVDRLQIENVCALVREWQTTKIPQMESACTTAEEKVRRMQALQTQDHEFLQTLHKSNAAIRNNFKMFHAIASGLDAEVAPAGAPAGSPGVLPPAGDDRLPPITSGRGSKPPSPGDGSQTHR